MKDEAAHLAMQMIKSGLIHYDPRLAQMRYTHQKMKREGGTTILRHLIFESVIFQFEKTSIGKIQMLDKEDQKKYIKGMSPDLTDNIIMLCGATCYDCYRMLSEDSGYMRKKLNAEEMLGFFNVDSEEQIVPYKKPKIRNSQEILNILSSI